MLFEYNFSLIIGYSVCQKLFPLIPSPPTGGRGLLRGYGRDKPSFCASNPDCSKTSRMRVSMSADVTSRQNILKYSSTIPSRLFQMRRFPGCLTGCTGWSLLAVVKPVERDWALPSARTSSRHIKAISARGAHPLMVCKSQLSYRWYAHDER